MRMIPVLAALDADHDGTISAKEIENAAVALRTLDKNGDGDLTAEEMRPSFGPGGRGPGGPGGPEGRNAGGPGGPGGFNPQAMIDRLMQNDKNGDGKLSKDELPDRMARMLTVADTDKDGALSKQEITAAMAGAAEHVAAAVARADRKVVGVNEAAIGRADPKPSSVLSLLGLHHLAASSNHLAGTERSFGARLSLARGPERCLVVRHAVDSSCVTFFAEFVDRCFPVA